MTAGLTTTTTPGLADTGDAEAVTAMAELGTAVTAHVALSITHKATADQVVASATHLIGDPTMATHTHLLHRHRTRGTLTLMTRMSIVMTTWSLHPTRSRTTGGGSTTGHWGFQDGSATGTGDLVKRCIETGWAGTPMTGFLTRMISTRQLLPTYPEADVIVTTCTTLCLALVDATGEASTTPTIAPGRPPRRTANRACRLTTLTLLLYLHSTRTTLSLMTWKGTRMFTVRSTSTADCTRVTGGDGVDAGGARVGERLGTAGTGGDEIRRSGTGWTWTIVAQGGTGVATVTLTATGATAAVGCAGATGCGFVHLRAAETGTAFDVRTRWTLALVADCGTLVDATGCEDSTALVATGEDDGGAAAHRLPGDRTAVTVGVRHGRTAPSLTGPWMAGSRALVRATGETATTDATTGVGNVLAGRHVARLAGAAEAPGSTRQGSVRRVNRTRWASNTRATAFLRPQPLLHAPQVDDDTAHHTVPTWVQACG
jgi:hypothetical protein